MTLRMKRGMRRLSCALAVVALSAIGTTARAGDQAAAEALFGEAKKLVAQGRFAEACPKFAESNRLDRGAGTLIHLGDCYEKNKQTASAWATYKEAASAAQALGRSDWEKLANTRATTLEPKMARLTVRVTDPADKIEVSRDGQPLSQASWSVALPVDTGAHTVDATAPGRKPFRTTTTIGKDGERTEVVVPKLEVAPEAVAKPASEKTPDADVAVTSDGSSQRTIGFIVGGVGVAGIAVGAVTGLMAMSKNDTAKKECPNAGACASQAGVDANESAKTMGLISTIAFIAGGVGIATGAVLIFTAPSGEKKSGQTRVVPSGSANSAGLTVLGTF